jgi:hypothetical protein
MGARHAMVGLLVLAASGCGGAPRGAIAAEAPAAVESRAEIRLGLEPDPEVSITGLMGGIDPHSIERALGPRMDELARCVEARRSEDVPLGGRVRLGLRIATDGGLRRALLLESTIGDRDAERCILGVVGATRFRAPSGGEAEASWTFDLETGEHVAWDARRVRGAIERGRARVARSCGEIDGVRVTAWVGARGRVLRAGASAPDVERDEAIDCVLDAISRWRMPDPRGRTARVTFEMR